MSRDDDLYRLGQLIARRQMLAALDFPTTTHDRDIADLKRRLAYVPPLRSVAVAEASGIEPEAAPDDTRVLGSATCTGVCDDCSMRCCRAEDHAGCCDCYGAHHEGGTR